MRDAVCARQLTFRKAGSTTASLSPGAERKRALPVTIERAPMRGGGRSIQDLLPAFHANPNVLGVTRATSTFIGRRVRTHSTQLATFVARRAYVTAMANTSTFNLALCQMPVGTDKLRNLSTAREYLRDAKAKGAHLAVLPECFNCPYDTKCFPEYAERIPDVGALYGHASQSVEQLQQAAEETDLVIIGGSIPEIAEGGHVYNTSVTVAPDGTILAKHRKMHMFDIDVPGGIRFRESDSLSPGNSITAFQATSLPCMVGVAICYDMRFPELAMLQARTKNARLLVYPGAFNMTTGPAHWELLLRARALDNQVYVAACSPARNTSGDGYTAWGHSTIVDPWGTVVATTDEKPCIVFATIDLAKVNQVRTSIPTSTQRRHDVYALQQVSHAKAL